MIVRAAFGWDGLPAAGGKESPGKSGAARLDSMAFTDAFETSDAGIVQLRSGIDVKARDERGWTMLFFAAMNAFSGAATMSAEQARQLLERGADVDAVDNEGRSALMVCGLICPVGADHVAMR